MFNCYNYDLVSPIEMHGCGVLSSDVTVLDYMGPILLSKLCPARNLNLIYIFFCVCYFYTTYHILNSTEFKNFVSLVLP